jgi:hypothetical protein
VTGSQLGFLDHPDPGRKIRKAAWLQTRRLVAQGVQACLPQFTVARPAVAYLTEDVSLPRALSADLGLPVTRLRPGDRPESGHVVALQLDAEARAADRLVLLSTALSSLRPSGKCVLIGTVVAGPDGASETPSMGRLMAEIDQAWGGGFHVDDLRSFRWLDEPFVRGVVLTLTALRTPVEAAP